ncbi:UNVERIFIED_ORG: hypothetical protein ABID33_000207 [Xanthobacter viscosus]|uniref:Uncharacterized protein n=1 Tax=Xanthobacter autotrophicus TaxID=280 RepID=A0A6C1KI72_XANAU|nr:hypothetical protein [Xanthobacter autotrophicus]TLX43895.1 hypothetical protein FBQ73_07290 [Xanthobacter autotrophicus]
MTETIDTAALALRVADDITHELASDSIESILPIILCFHDAEARALAALLRGVVDGREAWECMSCGRLSYRPEGDLRTMQANGYVGCCPERKLRAVRVISPAPPPEPAKTEAIDTLTDVQWLKKWTTETGDVLKGLWREEFLKTVRFVERHNLSALAEHDGREG